MSDIVQETSIANIVSGEGYVQVKLALSLTKDGNEVSSQTHIVMINQGNNIDHLFDLVNKHFSMEFKASGIKGAPWPSVSAADIEKVKTYAALQWA